MNDTKFSNLTCFDGHKSEPNTWNVKLGVVVPYGLLGYHNLWLNRAITKHMKEGGNEAIHNSRLQGTKP